MLDDKAYDQRPSWSSERLLVYENVQFLQHLPYSNEQTGRSASSI